MSLSILRRTTLNLAAAVRPQLCSAAMTLNPNQKPASIRFLSSHNPPTIMDPVIGDCPLTSGISKEDRSAFLALLPDVINSLTFNGVHKDLPDINQHLANCLQYNLVGGKLNSGLMVPMTYKLLTTAEQQDAEAMRRANMLGWCVELLQSFFLVADDMMDESLARRGKQCWYLKDNLGWKAVNDVLFMETSIYTLLHEHFHNQPNYLDFVEAFLYSTRHTVIGQSLDTLSTYSQDSSKRTCDLDNFNMSRCTKIMKFKTAYYSFYLPVQLGMGLVGIRDPELYRQARTILLEMGHFFQVQDDYLDCFGDVEDTGKLGTDIQDGKCSWLVVVALQRCTKAQKDILKRCYGSSAEDDVQAVKKVFVDLHLPKLYQTYEEQTYNDIMELINRMSGGSEKRTLNHDIFRIFLKSIYKRSR